MSDASSSVRSLMLQVHLAAEQLGTAVALRDSAAAQDIYSQIRTKLDKAQAQLPHCSDVGLRKRATADIAWFRKSLRLCSL